MRIVIGSESFHPNISGVAVATRNLASYLASEGHEVLVIAPSTDFSDSLEVYPEGFGVQRIRSFPNPYRKGFRVTLLPHREIKKIVHSWYPDLIHLEDPTSIGVCLLRAGQIYRIPVVISHHFSLEYILSYFKFLKPFHGIMRRGILGTVVRFYNLSQYVICPSDTVRRFLITTGIKVPIAAVSNGVDLSRFFSYESPVNIRSALRLPDIPIVLYVGRIDKDKNLEVLLAAIPLVLKRCQAHFVFCGSGNLLGWLRKRVTQDGMDSNVSLLGQLNHESQDLPRLYQISHCFVIPSQIETQSIVTLEAMASALPVVAARAGALPELVSEGETGLLFAPGDPVELAEKICELLEDEAKARQMGNNGMKKVVIHELHGNLHKIEQIYQEVIACYHD